MAGETLKEPAPALFALARDDVRDRCAAVQQPHLVLGLVAIRRSRRGADRLREQAGGTLAELDIGWLLERRL